jgi:hypothetical protein
VYLQCLCGGFNKTEDCNNVMSSTTTKKNILGAALFSLLVVKIGEAFTTGSCPALVVKRVLY